MDLNKSPFAHNVRYQLAKQNIEGLFLKWISDPKTSDHLNSLI